MLDEISNNLVVNENFVRPNQHVVQKGLSHLFEEVQPKASSIRAGGDPEIKISVTRYPARG